MSYSSETRLASPPSSSISSPRGSSFSRSSTVHGSVSSVTSYGSSYDGPNDSPRSIYEHQRSATQASSSYPAYGYDYAATDPRRNMNATQGYATHPHHGYMDNHQAHMANGALPSSMPQYGHYGAAPMQPPMHAYGQPQPAYYGYQPVSHPQHYPQHHHTTLPAPHMMQPTQPAPVPSASSRPQDTTGQVAPPNHKPKLTGTVWEDEGTICFQVEVNGICVARREDDHFINGTKLLNVANMTRGRRDGILKSEKSRKVIKIGPMHLKGVWIPFARALEFANKEKITEQLYPLFVNEIGPLLTPHMQDNLRNARIGNGRVLAGSSLGSSSQAPGTPSGPQGPGASASHSQAVAPISTTRSEVERPQGFPTPPTSTSSAVGASSSNNASYEWGPSSVGVASSSQAPAARSVPSTPTSGAPDHGVMGHYSGHYDASRSMSYAAPSSQGHYGSSQYAPMYTKTDLSAPTRAGEKEEDPQYANHDQSGYTYNSSDPPEHKTSPHHAGSGRATPRSMTTPQSQWQPSSYTTPQRSHQPLPSSSLTYGSSVASNGYAAPTPQSAYSYPTAPVAAGQKRGRDDDDDPYARPSNGADYGKRQKLLHEDSHSRPTIVQRQ